MGKSSSNSINHWTASTLTEQISLEKDVHSVRGCLWQTTYYHWNGVHELKSHFIKKMLEGSSINSSPFPSVSEQGAAISSPLSRIASSQRK